jgi:hypothetical protein
VVVPCAQASPKNTIVRPQPEEAASSPSTISHTGHPPDFTSLPAVEHLGFACYSGHCPFPTPEEDNMAFGVLFLAHAPDANGEIHRSSIDTGMYQLHSVVVRTQKEALDVCTDFLAQESIDSILLCPGFTHSEVAEIAQLAGEDVAVSVARGDGPSSRASLRARRREGYLSRRPPG